MAFPPEFSSTEKYANRYDLDEIDVFLEGNDHRYDQASLFYSSEQDDFFNHFFSALYFASNSDFKLSS